MKPPVIQETPPPPAAPERAVPGWKPSLFWLALAVGCFNAAYASLRFPAAGLLIFGYAFALVQLAGQPTVRRAFYFGLAAGLLGYALQLAFFWNIFSAVAVVLWLVLAFWIGLFTAIVCGCQRRWGRLTAAWLTPVVWTGIEFFRSELYPLKFAWLNIGYAVLPVDGWNALGVYGIGFLVFLIVAVLMVLWMKLRLWEWLLIVLVGLVLTALLLPFNGGSYRPHKTGLSIAGIQMEFPPESILPEALDRALAKNPAAEIFVLSEYTCDGPVPEALKNWCREHARFLIIGGKDPLDGGQFYDTAFVVDTNGDVVFKQPKCVPIQFFRDGRPAPEQKVWVSPWGKIGLCVCYDLSYRRVTDELIRQGAQLLIVPTMDVDYWGRHEHELHSRIAPVRAAEYRVPIFRLASSGISQAVEKNGRVVAQTRIPGNGDCLAATLALSSRGRLPLDHWFAPACTAATGLILLLLWLRPRRKTPPAT